MDNCVKLPFAVFILGNYIITWDELEVIELGAICLVVKLALP